MVVWYIWRSDSWIFLQPVRMSLVWCCILTAEFLNCKQGTIQRHQHGRQPLPIFQDKPTHTFHIMSGTNRHRNHKIANVTLAAHGMVYSPNGNFQGENNDRSSNWGHRIILMGVSWKSAVLQNMMNNEESCANMNRRKDPFTMPDWNIRKNWTPSFYPASMKLKNMLLICAYFCWFVRFGRKHRTPKPSSSPSIFLGIFWAKHGKTISTHFPIYLPVHPSIGTILHGVLHVFPKDLHCFGPVLTSALPLFSDLLLWLCPGRIWSQCSEACKRWRWSGLPARLRSCVWWFQCNLGRFFLSGAWHVDHQLAGDFYPLVHDGLYGLSVTISLFINFHPSFTYLILSPEKI